MGISVCVCDIQVGIWSTSLCAESGFGVITRVGRFIFIHSVAMAIGLPASWHIAATRPRGVAVASATIASICGVRESLFVRSCNRVTFAGGIRCVY